MKSIVEKIMAYQLIEHVLFVGLMVMSILLYQERLLADASYFIFKVINTGFFHVEFNRYILAFSQVLPVMAVQLKLPLKGVLILYSVGNVLFFYVLFLWARYRYQDHQAGIVLLLLQTAGLISGFYVPMFELYYSAGMMVLFLAKLRHEGFHSNFPGLGILTFFILTAHQFAFIYFVFGLFLYASENQFKFHRGYIYLLLFALIILVVKQQTRSAYEIAKSNEFIQQLKSGHYGWVYVKSFVQFMLLYYKTVLLLHLISMVYLLINKQWIMALVITLFFVGTCMVVNLSLYGFEHTRYQEQVYFPLSVLASFAFIQVLRVSSNLWVKKMCYTLVLIFVVSKSMIIWDEHNYFTARIQELKQLITAANMQSGSRFYVNENKLKYDPNWSYPLESLLFSTLDHPEKSISICTDTDILFNQNVLQLTPEKYLFRRWEIEPIESLNPNYFKLDRGTYILIK